jgi:hypothetical protein
MLDDRDVTLQWWCEEAGGRQTTYYERGVLGSVIFISVSVLMMMGVWSNAPNRWQFIGHQLYHANKKEI